MGRVLSRLVFLVLTAFLLTACGGGTGDDSSTTGGTSGDTSGGDPAVVASPAGTAAISMVVPDTTTELLAIDDSQAAEIQVRVTDGTRPLSRAIVRFSADIGVLDPASASALTDTSGIARITLRAGSIQGAGTVTAQVDLGEETLGVEINFETAGDSASATVTGGAIELALVENATGTVTTLVSNALPGRITALVTDSSTDPVADQLVTFTTTLGVLNPTLGTALTDASGIATIILRTGDVAGAGTVTASTVIGSNTITRDKSFVSAGDEPAGTQSGDGSITIVLQNGAGAPINNVNAGQPGTARATLVDANNIPLEGEVVSFTTTFGNVTPASGTALTDSFGVAEVTINAGTLAGAGTITASSGLVIGTLNFSTSGDEVITNTLSLAIDFSAVAQATPRTLTATLLDSGGIGILGKVVTFSTTLGSLSPVLGTALTNGSGVATITLSAGQVAGAGTASASISLDGSVLSDTVSFTDAGDGVLNGSLDLAISGTSLTALTPRTLTATVLDAAGVVVEGAVVTFATTLGELDPVLGTALTNNLGVATMSLTAGQVAGAGTASATASVGGSNVTDTVVFTSAGDALLTGSLALTIDNILVNAANDRTLTAIILDAAGDEVEGAVVTFATTLGELDPVLGTALTDNLGVATMTLTAGQVAGAGTASATASVGGSNVTDTVAFTTAGDAPDAINLELRLLDNTPANFGVSTASITNAVPGYLVATVTNSSGVVVGEVVSFSTGLGLLNPTSGTTLTDGNGQAVIVLRAGDVPGAAEAIATVTVSGVVAIDNIGFSTAGDGPGLEFVSGITLELEMLDPTLTTAVGTALTPLSDAAPGRLRATLNDANGDPIRDAIVSFGSGLGEITPANGTALTSTAGIAVVEISAGQIPGAAQATVQYGTATTSINFTTEGDEVDEADLPVITLDLLDGGGLATDTIRADAPGTLRITATNSAGAPLTSRIATVLSDLGTLNPATGKVLTDATTGIASIGLLAGSDVGAGMVTVTVGGTQSSINFQIATASLAMGNGFGAPGFNDGILLAGTDPLSAGGTTTITTTIVDTGNSNALYQPPVSITFTSLCVEAGTATIDSPVNAIGGTATSIYRADGCEGQDVISATADAGGSGLSASVTITVQLADAGSIEFISPVNGTVIALKGTGGIGLAETTSVVFRVLDDVGQPKPNQAVSFELDGGNTSATGVGGSSINSILETSNSDGEIQVVLSSGTVPTSLRVKAFFTGTSGLVSTYSDQITVGTGLPDDNSFQIVAETINNEVFSFSGETVSLTVFAADRFNNPAPDGTAISLIAEEGGFVDDSCTTTNGLCSVIWTSAGDRPSDGLTTIVAYALGEENFVDTDADGLFDDDGITPESIVNLPEVFLDTDRDGIRDTGEEYIDRNNSGVYDDQADVNTENLYNGTVCTAQARTAGHCAQLIHVRDDIQLIMTTGGVVISPVRAGADFSAVAFNSLGQITGVTGSAAPDAGVTVLANGVGVDLITAVDVTVNGSETISYALVDQNGNPPPRGATVSISTDNGKLSGTTSYTVGDQTTPIIRSLTLSEDTSTTASAGLLLFTVTSAKSVVTQYGITVIDAD